MQIRWRGCDGLNRMGRAATLVLGFIVGQVVVACASTTTRNEPARSLPPLDEQAAMALRDLETPCTIRTARRPEDKVQPIPQVFVEAFLLEIPPESTWRWHTNDLATLATVPGATLVGAPHIIAYLGDAATVSLGTHFFPIGTMPEPTLLFKGMTLRPSLGEADVLVLDLDVVLMVPAEASAQPASPYVDAHAHNTFAIRDRQVAALRTRIPGYAHGDLVVALVPHFIQSEVDLRDIFQCKIQRRAEHLQHAR